MACEVPPAFLLQDNFSDAASSLLNFTKSQASLLKRITSGSAIEKRHTVLTDFTNARFQGDFFESNGTAAFPQTGKRNDVYKNIAPQLAASVCHQAIEQWGGDRKDITHVISVSCTGMIAPGIEFILIDKLGLSQSVERLGINFMGCFGAFKGLAIAKALAMESPKHRVLVVCTELCSLHFQADARPDTMVANSIFADGAAAVIVGMEPSKKERPLFEIHNQGSAAIQNTLDFMTWQAGDYGYEMRLSASVPSYLEKNILEFARRITGSDLPFEECLWAIHPGGKSILEAVEKGCDLQREQLLPSWKVLNDYGNMSSATFLFVLGEVLKTSSRKTWTVGLGFGPGLSIEGLLLKRVDDHVAS